jgi:hypothetical protein
LAPLALGWVSSLVAPTACAEAVGRVLMAAGEAHALRDGKLVALKYGSAIQDRDTLQTGERSNLQVRFTDESIMSLRERTQMRIDEFAYSGKPGGGESAFFRLVRGAFRTVTGLIGRSDNSRYGVVTPVATIGIRGTMYAAGLCQQDCFNADGTPAPDGLYGMVIGPSQGTNQITLKNKALDPNKDPAAGRNPAILGQGQIFHLANQDSTPELLLEPPPHMIDYLAGAGKADRATETALGTAEGGGDTVSTPGSDVGELSAGGAASDSRPNSLPTALEQVAMVNGSFQTVQVPQLVQANGVSVALPPIQTQPFVGVGGTGIVRGQMLWTTTADMDLHMITPDNQHNYYGNPIVNFPASTPTAQAQLDVDNTSGVNHPTAVTTFQGQLHAVENIRVTGSSIPAGDYKFYVRNFSGAPTAPILLVTGDNGVTGRQYNVPTLTGGQQSSNYVVTRNPNGTASYAP